MTLKVENAIRAAVRTAAPGIQQNMLTAIVASAAEAVDQLVHVDPMTGAAHYDHEIGELPPLLPHEHLALVTALQQVGRGEPPSTSVATQCIRTLDRLAGGVMPETPTVMDLDDKSSRRGIVNIDGRGMSEGDIAAALGKLDEGQAHAVIRDTGVVTLGGTLASLMEDSVVPLDDDHPDFATGGFISGPIFEREDGPERHYPPNSGTSVQPGRHRAD